MLIVNSWGNEAFCPKPKQMNLRRVKEVTRKAATSSSQFDTPSKTLTAAFKVVKAEKERGGDSA